MHEACAVTSNGLVDELAHHGEVYQKVCVAHVLDWNSQVADSRRGVIGGYRFISDRHYMRDVALREDPG